MLVCCIPWDHKEWTQLSDCTEQNCDIEWFAFEMNRDHSVILEIASKYCILDSFVDQDGCSISPKGFLPTVVDIIQGEVAPRVQEGREELLHIQGQEGRQ